MTEPAALPRQQVENVHSSTPPTGSQRLHFYDKPPPALLSTVLHDMLELNVGICSHPDRTCLYAASISHQARMYEFHLYNFESAVTTKPPHLQDCSSYLQVAGRHMVLIHVDSRDTTLASLHRNVS